MLLVVAGFFGTIIAVNVFMAYAAISTFPGLNAKNSYVASQNYNLLLKDAAEQAERGWRAEIDTAGGWMGVLLKDAAGDPLTGLDVTVLAGRPSNSASDRLLVLEPWDKAYRSHERLDPGRWLIEIEARDAGALVWRETRAVIVESGTGS